MKTPEHTEGAGSIISNWVTADPSLEKKSTKMVVYSNVLAVKHGCITAHAMRQYSIEHPNIRLKEVLNADTTKGTANHEGPFGIKTKFAEESMDSLLQAKFTNFANEDSDYPTIVSIKKTGFMPTPRPTVASTSIIKAREEANEKKQPKHFIMKRFQNVKGTFEREREEQHAKRLAESSNQEEEE